MNRADRDLVSAFLVNQPFSAGQAGHFLEGMLAGGVPAEQLGHNGGDLGIGFDGLSTVWAGDVSVTEWSLGRPDALFRFFKLPLAGFLGKIVDVVLCH
ncbi:MAG: hypothetical protein O3B21_14570 [Proteobacteria bacterium]|nr:hypothetical protein [Pseudomonadota bacterium]